MFFLLGIVHCALYFVMTTYQTQRIARNLHDWILNDEPRVIKYTFKALFKSDIQVMCPLHSIEFSCFCRLNILFIMCLYLSFDIYFSSFIFYFFLEYYWYITVVQCSEHVLGKIIFRVVYFRSGNISFPVNLIFCWLFCIIRYHLLVDSVTLLIPFLNEPITGCIIAYRCPSIVNMFENSSETL